MTNVELSRKSASASEQADACRNPLLLSLGDVNASLGDLTLRERGAALTVAHALAGGNREKIKWMGGAYKLLQKQLADGSQLGMPVEETLQLMIDLATVLSIREQGLLQTAAKR